METVQSTIASDKTALYDVFKEGFIRLLQWNCPQKGLLDKLFLKLLIPVSCQNLLQNINNFITYLMQEEY